jgi:hypothetical protein
LGPSSSASWPVFAGAMSRYSSLMTGTPTARAIDLPDHHRQALVSETRSRPPAGGSPLDQIARAAVPSADAPTAVLKDERG